MNFWRKNRKKKGGQPEMWGLFLLMVVPLLFGSVVGWLLASVGQVDQFSSGFRAGIRVGRHQGLLRPVAGLESEKGGAGE
mgnify:CR=1 FL=1